MLSKIKLVLTALTLTALASEAALACDMHGKTGIVEDNNLYIPVGRKGMGGITEQQFNKVIDRVGALYSNEVSQKGGTLTFERNWTDGTVNAYAHRDDATGKIWYVSMFGGLARHPQMNEDAFAVVVCHELGHQIGGAPRKSNGSGGLRWASNEGQADYFATLKCLRRYFEGQDNQSAVSKMKVPQIVTNNCKSSFSNAEEIAVCQRSALAGEVLGNFFKVLMNSTTPLSFGTPDTSKVQVTYDGHPQSQCRLDTYFQGSLCDKSVRENVSDTDVNLGTCTKRNGDQKGLRPNCWYAGE
jgi:hypothetical protein